MLCFSTQLFTRLLTLSVLSLVFIQAFKIDAAHAFNCPNGQYLVSYSYVDRDQDGYFAQKTGQMCSRIRTLPQKIGFITYAATNPSKIIDECDSNSRAIYNVAYKYIDRDGDGHFSQANGSFCSSEKGLPQTVYNTTYASTSMGKVIDQCDYDKNALYSISYKFIDRDGDGFFSQESSKFCSGVMGLPQTIGGRSYALTNPQPVIDECDNDKNTLYNVSYSFADRDGDGYFSQISGKVCSNVKTLPQAINGVNYASKNPKTVVDQCDYDSSSIYKVAYSFIDRDGDGFFVKESGSFCSELKNLPQTGYEYGEVVTYAATVSNDRNYDCDKNNSDIGGKLNYSHLDEDQDGYTVRLAANKSLCPNDPLAKNLVTSAGKGLEAKFNDQDKNYPEVSGHSNNNSNSGGGSYSNNANCGCGYGKPVFDKDNKVKGWKGKRIVVRKTGYTPTWGGDEGGPRDAFGELLKSFSVANPANKGVTSGAAGNNKSRGPFGNLRSIKMRDDSVKVSVQLVFDDAVGTLNITDVGSDKYFSNGPSADGSIHVDVCINPGGFLKPQFIAADGSYLPGWQNKTSWIDNRYHPLVNGKTGALLCQLDQKNYEKYCVCDSKTLFEDNEACFCSQHPNDNRCNEQIPCEEDPKIIDKSLCKDDDSISDVCPIGQIMDQQGNCVDPNAPSSGRKKGGDDEGNSDEELPEDSSESENYLDSLSCSINPSFCE